MSQKPKYKKLCLLWKKIRVYFRIKEKEFNFLWCDLIYKMVTANIEYKINYKNAWAESKKGSYAKYDNSNDGQ